MRISISHLLALGLLFLGAFVLAKSFRSEKASGGVAIVSAGNLSLELPPTWKTMESLNPRASLEVGDELADAYLIVVSEKKTNSKESDLGRYSQWVRGKLRDSLKPSGERGPWWVTVGSHRGLRYEILGISQSGTDLVYLHTVVETPEFFHQVVGWTQAANYEKNRNALRKISDSLRESGK